MCFRSQTIQPSNNQLPINLRTVPPFFLLVARRDRTTHLNNFTSKFVPGSKALYFAAARQKRGQVTTIETITGRSCIYHALSRLKPFVARMRTRTERPQMSSLYRACFPLPPAKPLNNLVLSLPYKSISSSIDGSAISAISQNPLIASSAAFLLSHNEGL